MRAGLWPSCSEPRPGLKSTSQISPRRGTEASGIEKGFRLDREKLLDIGLCRVLGQHVIRLAQAFLDGLFRLLRNSFLHQPVDADAAAVCHVSGCPINGVGQTNGERMVHRWPPPHATIL